MFPSARGDTRMSSKGRFFRAMFYYAKVRTFGAVPWYETSIDAADRETLYKDRDNREYVCRKILDDLNYSP